MRIKALHAGSLHYVQPLPCSKQGRTIGAQAVLAWTGRQARSCLAHSMVQTDAPGCSEDPAPPARYRGVSQSKSQESYTAAIQFRGKQHYLGRFATPAEAAAMYDKARIYLKQDPINFPGFQYDETTIHQFPDFDTFIRMKRPLKKRDTFSRFHGVSRSHGGRNGKWVSVYYTKGQQHSLGNYATEELAAQAHDKVCIYQGVGAKNFPEASYDVESICQQESIGSLIASIRAQAAALTSATFTSRYTGVYHLTSEPGIYQARIPISNCRLGRFREEEEAAMAYDHFCIYQGSAPVNFPDHPYNTQEICRPADLTEFVHRSREMAARLTKLRQTSRYTGVSWNSEKGSWTAYVFQEGIQVRLGQFASEEEAARLVDKRRQKLGQEIVNFPLESIDLRQFGSEAKAARWVNTRQWKGQEIVDFPMKSRQTPVGKTWPDSPTK